MSREGGIPIDTYHIDKQDAYDIVFVYQIEILKTRWIEIDFDCAL